MISSAESRANLLGLLSSADPIWIDIDADFTGLGADASAVIVDVPLNVTSNAKRIAELMGLLPRGLPKLFIINKTHRVEVVRASVLGATSISNRPLSEFDLGEFFRAEIIAAPQASDGGLRVAALVSSSLANILDAVLTDEAINIPTVEEASGEIASTLDGAGLESWLQTVREHHQGTLQHCLIVAGVMTRFGQQLGMSEDDVRRLTRIGLLHDVGKATIPTALLDKPSKLTDDEFSIIKTHPYRGFRFLSKQGILGTDELAAVVGHHEYLDGSGYPYALMDKSIGDLVRITTVCDVYSALIERRPYKREMSPADALDILNKMASEGKVELSLVRALARSLD
ncbi:HD-GYP domain-containing protein [Devosia soli]|uniref:HD-GYP domain-containing protein n=1 Tax=Devosia soli TaxID=361041 RepID=UPI00069C57E8|nr:HD domain-containing phosphohydrolase [Devosia soli]